MEKMNRIEKKITEIVNKCVDWLSVVLFLLIFILALGQIFMRYVLNRPLVWSEELIRYAFVWICYLGWVLGTRNRSHYDYHQYVPENRSEIDRYV